MPFAEIEALEVQQRKIISKYRGHSHWAQYQLTRGSIIDQGTRSVEKGDCSHRSRNTPGVRTSGSEVAFFRLCWDSITLQQHQLIACHPIRRPENVFFPIGGSFHGWKFLPTMGRVWLTQFEATQTGRKKINIGAGNPRDGEGREIVTPIRI